MPHRCGIQPPNPTYSPGTNPEESCQICFQRLHNKDTWLCDQVAGQFRMGYITEEVTRQQTRHDV